MEEIDETITILMKGDATVTLEGDERSNLTTMSQDGGEDPVIVDGVPPARPPSMVSSCTPS